MSDIIVETRHEIKFNIGMEDFIIPAESKGRIIDIQIDEDTTTMFFVEFENDELWLSADQIVSIR